MISLLPIVLIKIALFTGGPVTVQCPIEVNGGYSWGEADQINRVISLEAPVCRDLNWFTRHHRLPVVSGEEDLAMDTSDALMAAVHEAGHIRYPGMSEGCVQRYAVRHVKFFAEDLGARPKLARKIEAWSRLTTIDMDPEYRHCAALPLPNSGDFPGNDPPIFHPTSPTH